MRIETPEGTGSGTIITSDGIILTNYHVVKGYDRVTIRVENQRSIEGTVVGYDVGLDLAVVKIEGGPWRYLPISTHRPSVGDEILAIGYPLGLPGQSTVTKGLVSAFRPETRLTWIQTDAAINPGNSGGTAITSDGRFIGVPTKKATRGENIGFLIGLFSVAGDITRLMDVRTEYRLFINGIQAPPQNKSMFVSAGTVTLSLAPRPDGTYPLNTSVTLAFGSPQRYQIIWGGVDSQSGAFATVKMNSDRFVTLDVRLLPTPSPAPTATPPPPSGRYTNFANNYSIDVPVGWTADESTGIDTVAIWSSDRKAVLSVSRLSSSRGYTLDGFTNAIIESVTSNTKYVRGSLVRSSATLSSGLRGSRLTYQWNPGGEFCDSRIERISLFLGLELYSLYGSICEADTTAKLEQIRKMQDSFRFR